MVNWAEQDFIKYMEMFDPEELDEDDIRTLSDNFHSVYDLFMKRMDQEKVARVVNGTLEEVILIERT